MTVEYVHIKKLRQQVKGLTTQESFRYKLALSICYRMPYLIAPCDKFCRNMFRVFAHRPMLGIRPMNRYYNSIFTIPSVAAQLMCGKAMRPSTKESTISAMVSSLFFLRLYI